MSMEVLKMYEGLIVPKDVRGSNIFLGVTDFGNLAQIDYMEGGYNYLIHLDTPVFLRKLGDRDDNFKQLLEQFIHVIEHEFKGLDGLENLTSETVEISDAIRQINLISKVNEQAASTVTLSGYKERRGSLINKVLDIYLRGIKDGATQYKTYHGLIEDGVLDSSYENEVWKWLYITTDNTGLKIETAYMLLAGQFTESFLGEIANGAKGDIAHKELSLSMNCFPVRGPEINQRAQQAITAMNIVRRTEDMTFTGVLD